MNPKRLYRFSDIRSCCVYGDFNPCEQKDHETPSGLPRMEVRDAGGFGGRRMVADLYDDKAHSAGGQAY